MAPANKKLETAIYSFLKDELLLGPADKLLLYTDDGSHVPLIESITGCAQKHGIAIEHLHMDSTSPLHEMHAILRDKIESDRFNVICELSENYFYPTPAWKAAIAMGSRIYALGALDSNAFMRCVGQVDKNLLNLLGRSLYTMLNRTKHIHVLSELGTDIHIRMGSFKQVRKVLAKFKLAERSKVWPPSGPLKNELGSTTFLGGQVAFMGIPSSIHGTAVIDGYFWPPEEIGPVQHPISLEIKNGRVLLNKDNSPVSVALKNWLKGKSPKIEHFCIGFNPGARINGRIMEAERTFGSLVLGIGKYPYHTDGVLKAPTIKTDTMTLLENGAFIPDALAKTAAQLQKIDPEP